jgi:hypothetical protein
LSGASSLSGSKGASGSVYGNAALAHSSPYILKAEPPGSGVSTGVGVGTGMIWFASWTD